MEGRFAAPLTDPRLYDARHHMVRCRCNLKFTYSGGVDDFNAAELSLMLGDGILCNCCLNHPNGSIRVQCHTNWSIARTTAQPQVFPFLLELLLVVSSSLPKLLGVWFAMRLGGNWLIGLHTGQRQACHVDTHLPPCLLIFCHSCVLFNLILSWDKTVFRWASLICSLQFP